MRYIIKPGTTIDFIGKTRIWMTISAITFVLSLVLIWKPGIKYGLDFSGGHEILVAFDKPVTAEDVRKSLSGIQLGDTSVQSYQMPNTTKTHFLIRVQKTANLGPEELAALNKAFAAEYGDKWKGPLKYSQEIGDVIDVEFVGQPPEAAGATTTATAAAAANPMAHTSTLAMAKIVEATGHPVRLVKRVGRPDEAKFEIRVRGIDATVLKQLRSTIDPGADSVRVDFVGPTVGKQLRDQGIAALFYAMILILVYIAFRFDFFYSPGGVLCLFHDSICTVGVLVLMGEEFSLATIAGLLTLVGYSINDTIVVFDRIRETAGKAHGESLKEIVNKAVNETLNRTIGTSMTVFLACLCLMFFGKGTVLYHYGLIMAIGVIFGTYSSVYIASPIFIWLRERFGEPVNQPRGAPKGSKSTQAVADHKS
jgi:preprotein translocase subunit SecF